MTMEWIETLAATFAAIILLMAALGVGLLFGRPGPQGGSCGRFRDGPCACAPGDRPCETARWTHGRRSAS